MKKIISMFFMLFLCSVIEAQYLPKDKNGNYKYEETVTVNDLGKNEVYKRIKEFLSLYFEDDKLLVDQENEVIKMGEYTTKSFVIVIYEMSLSPKEGSYNLRIDEFEVKKDGLNGITTLKNYIENVSNGENSKLEVEIDNDIRYIITNLKYYVENGKMKKKQREKNKSLINFIHNIAQDYFSYLRKNL